MKGLLIAPALAGAAALLATPALADDIVYPALGGQGDRAEEYRCPPGEFLVGVRARTGDWIDQISILCSAFQAPAMNAVSLDVMPPRGGNGGAPNNATCLANAAVREIEITAIGKGDQGDGFLERLQYVKHLTFKCYYPHTGADAGGRAIWSSPHFPPNTYEMPPRPNSCYFKGVDDWAIGLNIRYGKHINAIGLICGPFVALPPLQSPKPKGPFTGVVHAAPMGRTPLRTGASEARESSGSGVGALLTVGTFDTSFGRMELGVKGGTYSVHDGKLRVRTTHDNIVEGVWTQTTSARKCSNGGYWGNFVFAFDAKGFTGFYGYCDDPPTAGEWNGTRR